MCLFTSSVDPDSDYELAEAVPTSWYQIVYSLALFVAPVLYFAIFFNLYSSDLSSG